MKCRFEHDDDCCNSGSPQYMCKCKPDICHSSVPMTNADKIRAMSDEELADMFAEFAEENPSDDASAWYEWLIKPSESL